MTFSCHICVPLLVGQLLEANLVGLADVVHETLDRAERLCVSATKSLGGAGLREIARNRSAAPTRPRLVGPVGVPSVDHDARPFGREQRARSRARSPQSSR